MIEVNGSVVLLLLNVVAALFAWAGYRAGVRETERRWSEGVARQRAAEVACRNQQNPESEVECVPAGVEPEASEIYERALLGGWSLAGSPGLRWWTRPRPTSPYMAGWRGYGCAMPLEGSGHAEGRSLS